MKWQELGNLISAIFNNSLVASLLGVIVGGLVTYYVQKHSINEQQKFEREKMLAEENKKNQAIKIQAYNKILHLNSVIIIFHLDHHTGIPELYNDNYIEHIRPILYENYHLLSDEIAKEFNSMESIFERRYVMGEEDDDEIILGESWLKIIKSIRQELTNVRTNRS